MAEAKTMSETTCPTFSICLLKHVTQRGFAAETVVVNFHSFVEWGIRETDGAEQG